MTLPTTVVAGQAGAIANFNETYDKLDALGIAGRVSASSALTLTASTVNIPGATVTIAPTVPGVLVVVGTFDFSPATAGEVLAGQLKLDGSVVGPNQDANYAGDRRLAVSRSWALTLTAGSHTVALAAKRATGSNADHAANEGHTGFSYCFHPAV